MKKTLLYLFAGFLSAPGFTQSTVPNYSFESWYDLSVKDSLDHWFTSTLQYQLSGYLDVNNAYATTNAYMGSNALHLQTISWFDPGLGETDTVFGYAVKEAADGGGFYGFPYTDTVDIFTCWYKCGIVAGDNALIVVELKKGGVAYSTTTYPIVGTQNSWSQLNIPLLNGDTEEPDSVFVGFVSSDPFTPGVAKPGSWLEVDEISFGFLAGSVTPAPIPNNGFENWTYETIEQPTSWFTFDELIYPAAGTVYATQSSTASHGVSSLQLETTFETIMFGIPAVATNGDFDQYLDSIVGGTPFIAQPAQISGMYQFAPSFTDTALVYVDFWNATSGIHNLYIDTLLDAAVWTPWSIDLTFTEAPDSVLVYFFSGANLGSTLLLDNIQFTGGDVSVDEAETTENFSLYPNPANTSVTVVFDSADVIRIFDLSGKLISSMQVTTENQTELNVTDLDNGIYIIQVIADGKASANRITIQH